MRARALAAFFVARAAADDVSVPIEVEIDSPDGQTRYGLFAGSVGCGAAFVAEQFLKTHAENYGDDGVARLTETLSNRPGLGGGAGRGCGWADSSSEKRFVVGAVASTDSATAVSAQGLVDALGLRFLDVGAAQSWWWSARPRRRDSSTRDARPLAAATTRPRLVL